MKLSGGIRRLMEREENVVGVRIRYLEEVG